MQKISKVCQMCQEYPYHTSFNDFFLSVFSVSYSLLDIFCLRFAFETVNFKDVFGVLLADFSYPSRLYWKISAFSGSLYRDVLIA